MKALPWELVLQICILILFSAGTIAGTVGSILNSTRREDEK